MLYTFGEYRLDAKCRELRRELSVVEVEPQVFDLLLYLIQQRHRLVSKEDLISAIWNDRIVTDSTIATRINAARRAIGDDGVSQRHIRTAQRRGIRFVSEVNETRSVERSSDPHSTDKAFEGRSDLAAREEITFCRSADGTHLAVANVGHGPTILKTASWLTHIERDWQMRVSSAMLSRLASRHRLIRYDQRGNGLSDRNVSDFSFAALSQDLDAVVDALAPERFTLFGISQGAAVAIAYAARHPDRVSRLILCGGVSRGFRKRGTADEIATREALATLMRDGWGKDNAAFRQVFTSLVFPDATQELIEEFNALQRLSTSPENAASLFLSFGDMDVSGLLQEIAVPTLVIHSREDALVPFTQGLELAQAIPHARFAPLESRNHIPIPDEPAWPHFMALIEDFDVDPKVGPERSSRDERATP